MQPAVQSKAPVSLLKSKWEPCALQGLYLDPIQHGTGEQLGQGH